MLPFTSDTPLKAHIFIKQTPCCISTSTRPPQSPSVGVSWIWWQRRQGSFTYNQTFLTSALFPMRFRRHFLRTYETTQAPPATVFLHDRHCQIPTECRFTEVLPQNVQVYRACCVISIFLTCFRREAPYLYVARLVPYNCPDSWSR